MVGKKLDFSVNREEFLKMKKELDFFLENFFFLGFREISFSAISSAQCFIPPMS